MRVLIAPDSFKGSLPADEVAEALATGIRSVHRGAEITLCPMSDGGEGFSSYFLKQGAHAVRAPVVDAYGRPGQGYWTLWQDHAIVESAIGSPFLGPTQRPSDALDTTSRGTGMLVRHAIEDARVRQVSVALGGTGSVDAGLGFLLALGASAVDRMGYPVKDRAKFLANVVRIDLPTLGKPIRGFADVRAPLAGLQGAVYQFGPQKGLESGDVSSLDRAFRQVAEVVPGGRRLARSESSGAAGGIGFGVLVLGGTLVSGALAYREMVGFAKKVQKAEWVLTGEGRLDFQSTMGKVVSVVSKDARRAGKRLALVVGDVASQEVLDALDPDLSYALTDAAGGSRSRAMTDAYVLLVEVGKKLAYRMSSDV